MRYILALITLLNVINTVYANESSVAYQNKRGSVLMLERHPQTQYSGTLTGTFTTAVANKKCKQVIGVPKPIMGYYDGDALSVTAAFPECGGIVTFVGNEDAGHAIETLWIDVRQAEHPETTDLNTRLIGHDLFKKQQVTKH